MSSPAFQRATSTIRVRENLSLVAQWETLNVQLGKEREKPDSGMLVGNPEAKRLAEEITALEDLMQESTVIVTHEALSRKQWTELVAAHPQREGVADDETWGVNVSTFVDAALRLVVTDAAYAKSGARADRYTDPAWTASETLSNAQWNEFAFDLFRLNNTVTAGPTSRTASLVMRSSEKNSEQPEA